MQTCKFVSEISFNDAKFKKKEKEKIKIKMNAITIHLKIKEKEKLIGLRSYYLHEAF